VDVVSSAPWHLEMSGSPLLSQVFLSAFTLVMTLNTSEKEVFINFSDSFSMRDMSLEYVLNPIIPSHLLELLISILAS